MEKRYLLPVTSLLASTRGVHQELFFQTRLSALRISQEECLVQLLVRDGTMLLCEIKETTGGPLLFQQERAIEILQSLGLLEWYRAPPPANHAEGTHEQRPLSWQSGPPARSVAEQIPVRRRSHADLPIFDHFHRRVFLLIDGTRSIHQIAKLLGKDPEGILGILRDLQEQNIISLPTGKKS